MYNSQTKEKRQAEDEEETASCGDGPTVSGWVTLINYIGIYLLLYNFSCHVALFEQSLFDILMLSAILYWHMIYIELKIPYWAYCLSLLYVQ